MCIKIPRKVVKVNKDKIIINEFGKEKEVLSKLFKIKKGDYVIIDHGAIVEKIPKD